MVAEVADDSYRLSSIQPCLVCFWDRTSHISASSRVSLIRVPAYNWCWNLDASSAVQVGDHILVDLENTMRRKRRKSTFRKQHGGDLPD